MSYFGRWTQAVVSRIDHLVTQVENHESLAESTLRDVQRSLARARVRLNKVLRDGRRLEEQRRSAKLDAQKWQDRALATPEEQKPRALECLRRSQILERQAADLEVRVGEHRVAEKQLQRDVERVETRFRELKEKRNLLRTRQSRAEALSASRAADQCGGLHLDQVFERWEERITTIELDDDEPTSATDSFEMDFLEQEELGDLEAQLEALRGEHSAAGVVDS